MIFTDTTKVLLVWSVLNPTFEYVQLLVNLGSFEEAFDTSRAQVDRPIGMK